MIKHIVLWNLKHPSRPLSECADALEIKTALENMRGKIPGLLSVEVGFDFSGKETAADIALITEFESREALDSYLEHPAHVAVGTVVRPRVGARRMIDFEVE